MIYKRCLIVILLTSCVFASLRTNAQNTDSTTTLNNIPAEAKVALFNHYYLPMVPLHYKAQLALTGVQVAKLKVIDATLKLKKIETDVSTKRNEHMLDSLFRTGRVNEGVIIFYTNRYGLYEGEYRGAILIACYNTRKVLTPQQINKLIGLENHN